MRYLIFPLMIVSATLLSAQSVSPIPVEARAAMAELRKEPFRAHMAFLAGDLLEGRGTGTRGHEIAARYVAAQFEAIGLRPAGLEGTYLQRVPLRKIFTDRDKCSLVIRNANEKNELRWEMDYLPLAYYRLHGRDSTSLDAGVAFAGYGVATPDGKYDDYVGLDVRGKIVALLEGAPPALSSELRAIMADLDRKVRLALSHGAVGILVLHTPAGEKLYPWSKAVSEMEAPGLEWFTPDGNRGDIPDIEAAAILSEPAAAQLFVRAQKSWPDVLGDALASKPQGFPLAITVRLNVAIHHETLSSPNVAAVLAGSDPTLKGQYVLYSAHLDHLGIGNPVNGDAIYNGAVDNASGVAALILLAKAFDALKRPPARSILFLAVTGEEVGMLGSDYYAHFPTVPIDSIAADINIDGASVLYRFKDVVPLGAWDSTLGAVVERNAARLQLKVSPDPEPDQFYFIRSDQYSFVRKGIPALFLTEGFEAVDSRLDGKKLTDDWNNTRYHSPSDDMNQPLNFDASVQFMDIEFLIGYDVAEDPERPKWNSGDIIGTMFSKDRDASH